MLYVEGTGDVGKGLEIPKSWEAIGVWRRRGGKRG
jgi:hypothetical protein